MNIPVNENAPVLSEGAMEISAPTDVVWRVLTEINDWPTWQGDVTQSALQGELREGAEFKWKAGGISFRSKIHTMTENRMFGWTGQTLGASAIHNWRFAEGEGTTVVTVQESLQGFLPVLFRKYFRKNLDMGIQKNLEELRSASEARVSH